MKKKIKQLLEKSKDILKEHWTICIVIFIATILNLLALYQLGYKYTLNSDDLSYVNSGIEFLKTGRITMHGVLSAQIMPGMTFFIAILCLFFGTGNSLWLVLKLCWITMGIITILNVYKSIRLFANKYISAIPCLFFLAADFIWTNNIILTETPFIFIFSLLIYHTLKLVESKSVKDYILIVIYYIIGVFIRPNIGIFPVFIVIYFLLKKYDFKLLIKQCFIAGIVLVLTLIPWIYRNYQVFDKFIPLTYGMGNPLLLGTYQGEGYPSDEELDYVKNVDSKMSDDMIYYMTNTEEKPHLTRYYRLEYDGLKAEYRMNYWWEHNKSSMIKSYLFLKPQYMVYSWFYWDTVLGVPETTLQLIRKIEIIIFVICSIAIIINKKFIKELIFLILVYGSQIALYSYTFAFSRYAITLFFIRFVLIGFGLKVIYDEIIKWRSKKNESINDNSSVQRRTKHRKHSKENNKLQPKIKK